MEQLKDRDSPEQLVKDTWNLDWKFGSVLQGDCYRAIKKSDKGKVLLWLTHEAISAEHEPLFFEHVERLLSVRDWGEIDFGLDAERLGYVELRESNVKNIDFDGPDTTAIRNRFLMCLILVAKIHEAKAACGNLTRASFVLNSQGVVEFTGFLGGYNFEVTPAVPLDIRHFLNINDGIQGAPSTKADVYSLALIGLTLFGAQFPPGSIDLGQIGQYLERLKPDAPQWVSQVLAAVVSDPKRTPCIDACELIRMIERKDSEYLSSLNQSSAKQSDQSIDERAYSLDELRALLVTRDELRKKRIQFVVQSKPIRIVCIGLLICLLLILLAGKFPSVRQAIPDWVGTRLVSGSGASKISEATGAVNLLKGIRRLDGSSINSSGAKKVGAEANDRAKASSSGDTLVAVDNPQSKIHIEPDSVLLAHIVQGDLTAEERSSILDLYGELDDESKVRLALAHLTAGGESERVFRELLEKQAPQGLLTGKGAPERLSTDALFLVVESRISSAAINSWSRSDQLSEQELWWLAQVLAKKRSTLFPFVARLIMDRGLVEFPKSIFLKIVIAAEPGSGAPYEALFNLSKQPATSGEINTLLNWDDPAASQALFVVLLSSVEPEVVKGSMTALLNKPGVSDLAHSIIQTVLNAGEKSELALASLVGSLGMVEAVGRDRLLEGMRALSGDAAKDSVLSLLLEKGSPDLIGAVLEVFGSEIHPDRLIQLLERDEPSIRKAVVPFLKGVTIASSKARIRDYYEAEKDPDVRRVFESELYVAG
jgi:hypothetical protein